MTGVLQLAGDRLAFLKRLLQTPGPSGFESEAARIWRDQAAKDGGIASCDAMGNSYAEFNPTGAPTVLLVGHLDEIGVIVHYIDDDGFVRISPIGGWDPHVLVGQRIRFHTSVGPLIGLVGRKPIHLIPRADREKGVDFRELWVDLGARSGDEAKGMISVGDSGVIDAPVVELPNRTLASRSLDNRVGAFVVLEAARIYAQHHVENRVVALAASQEEIARHGGGALVGANRHAPRAAVVVDLTFATDHPDVEKKEIGSHRLGHGPVISRGGILSPALFSLFSAAAERLQIPYSVQASPGATGTDADAIARSGSGVPVALISIPNRYMHSPNEMVSLDDVERTAVLIAEVIRQLTDQTDFHAR